MAVTSKHLPNAQKETILSRRIPQTIAPMAYLITALLAIVAIYVIVNSIIQWGKVTYDDIRYGRPRTTHVSGLVGHDEANGQPSRFLAMNLDRQVVIVEFPGGAADKVRTFPGPYLFGTGEDLTPVGLALHDIDQDGYNDLIATIRNEQIVYLNRDGTFRLPTEEEQRALMMKEQQP